MVLIVGITFYKPAKNWESLFPKLGLALTIYLLMATIVHPWYILALVAFACFYNYRYAMLWSAMAVLSYYTYRDDSYTENLWLVVIEYGAVLLFFILQYNSKRIYNKDVKPHTL